MPPQIGVRRHPTSSAHQAKNPPVSKKAATTVALFTWPSAGPPLFAVLRLGERADVLSTTNSFAAPSLGAKLERRSGR
jgi:hypothetical protein